MDEQLFFLINGHHNLFFDQFMWMVSQKTVWIPLYVALLYTVWRNYSWRGVMMILVMVGLGMLVTDTGNHYLLRPWIGRLRPSNPDNPIAPLVHTVNGGVGKGCGFPSAHSANIWLLSFLMIHFVRNRMVTVAMVCAALLVCYSRVYLGYHYPGDILGGFALAGLTTTSLICLHRRCMHFQPKDNPQQAWVPGVAILITVIAFLFVAVMKS